MKNILFLVLLFIGVAAPGAAQDVQTSDEDIELRLELKKKYRSEAVNFSHKQFDEVFLDFFRKTGPTNPEILTKEEFYGYTVRISWYSERMGLLYKKEKETAKKSADEWFNKKYSDYLATKKEKP